MKITGYGSIQSTTSTKKTGQTGAAGNFADVLAAAEGQEAAAASPVSDVAALSNLLALQEISEEDVKRKKLMQQGKTMLEVLEDLRRQLLTGGITPQVARDLARHIHHEKQFVADPRLNEIIEDIELRAAVELAKLEKALKDNAVSAPGDR